MEFQHFIIAKSDTQNFWEMKLEETLHWIELFSFQFSDEINFLKKYEKTHSEEVEKLLSERTLNRYKGTALSLSVPYEKYNNSMDAEDLNLLEQGLLVQSWSTLGSHLESTLQMFLAFYYRHYIVSNWRVWDEKAIIQIDEVLTGSFKETLEEIISSNTEEEGLTNNIKRSFISKAKDILKSRKKLPSIERITLSDLIDFYFHEDILVSKEYNQKDLQKIRDYRNSIHAFQERTIGSWEEYNDYLKTIILLLIDMLDRLPILESEDPMPEWYSTQKSALTMKENEWFKYQVKFNI